MEQPFTPPVGEETPFLVDLTKEEYIAFQLLVAKVRGPLRSRTVSLILSVGLCMMMLVTTLLTWRETGQISIEFLLIAVLTLIPGLFAYCIVPAQLKKRASKNYDQARQSGNNFVGTLTVYPDRVEKIGQAASAKIPLHGHTLFIETEDMMVFTTMGSLALVLPARCMTEEMAVRVRQAADQLPPANRRFISRFRPQGQPVTAPESMEKPEVLWEQQFTFTEEEYVSLVRSALVQRYWPTAPWLVGLSLVAGYAFIYDEKNILTFAGGFLLFFGLMTLFNLVLPLSRVRRQALAAGQPERTYRVELDDIALRLYGHNDNKLAVVWEEINHVYDRDTFVEFVMHRHTTFRIPKRCIEDVTAFGEIITRCRKKQ